MASKTNGETQASRNPGESGVEPKARRGRAMLMMVSVVLLLGAGGAAATWYFNRGQDAAAPQPPVFVSMETFTVNLQSEYNDQHLQTSLTLKVGDAAAAEQVKLHMPELRNRVLLLLSGKAAAQIATTEGKEKLASELALAVNRTFGEAHPGWPVERVLFTSFVIQ
ncbi:flagellar basal body-associated protein FliL [Nitrosovibrio sp. Nv17]|uniref:flagellar basal body-associated protein FliL n=1 Tax=Nitrosovibrio sp. Nv17 TaxID=1855339 RepID=UPI000908BAC1|nr:flagellar basal body-associated protein FliL [Nitrosovibrio sp. Nv17]SFW14388.1 flagellar FliL protein [Nitrosovibrio sp. Nv17]